MSTLCLKTKQILHTEQWTLYNGKSFIPFFPLSQTTLLLGKKALGWIFFFTALLEPLSISFLHKWILQQIGWVQDHLACSISSATSCPYMQPPPYILLFHYSVFLVLPLLLSFCLEWQRATERKSSESPKGILLACCLKCVFVCFMFKVNMSAKITAFLCFASFLWKHGIKQMTLLSLKTMFHASS